MSNPNTPNFISSEAIFMAGFVGVTRAYIDDLFLEKQRGIIDIAALVKSADIKEIVSTLEKYREQFLEKKDIDSELSDEMFLELFPILGHFYYIIYSGAPARTELTELNEKYWKQLLTYAYVKPYYVDYSDAVNVADKLIR